MATLVQMVVHDMMSKPQIYPIVRRIVVVPRLLSSLELIPILHRRMLGRRRVVFDMSKTLLHLMQDRPITLPINNGKGKILNSRPRMSTVMAPPIVRTPDVNIETLDGDLKMALLVLLVPAECRM